MSSSNIPPMRLTILGSGTAVPSARRSPPGHLLRIGQENILFDTGAGTMQRLERCGVPPERVGHIFYSHNHLDHTGDLAPWLFASHIPTGGRTSPLTIAGSAGFMEMLSGLRALHGDWLDATGYRLELITMDGDGAAITMGDWMVQAFPVRHIPSSLGYRVTRTGGKTFAYTGDTDVCESLVDLARDVDTLLIEASAPDGAKIPKHLTATEAGEIARRAGARRVVLTHLYPACDRVDMLEQVRRSFSGEAILAEDGLTLEI